MRRLIIGTSILLCIANACNTDEKEVPAPTIYFANEGNYEISQTDTLILSPKITYDKNSVYSWKVNGVEVSTDLEYMFVASSMNDFEINFSVKNDNGSDSYDIQISCIKNLNFDSFDNLVIPKQQKLILFADTLETLGFKIDDITFSNEINADTTMWGGFAFSNRTVITNTISTSAIGCAYIINASSSNYMVISGYSTPMIDFGGRKYTAKTIDIANDNFSYLVSKFGYTAADSSVVADCSKKNDELTLRIIGLNEQGSDASQIEYNLVDCRFDNPAKYERLSTWKTIELKGLGEIYGLRFEIVSTQANFPPFVCIDNLKLQD